MSIRKALAIEIGGGYATGRCVIGPSLQRCRSHGRLAFAITAAYSRDTRASMIASHTIC
jgi:hypothetical protein